MKYITEINKAGKIAVDDNILVKDVLSSAGSRMLEGFAPVFSAEAVDRLEKAGYTISGKTNVGEFGLDLLGETSYYGATIDGECLVGAAASLVAEGEVEGALSVDCNGYPRRAAAVSGVAFVKPTYSTVSRYGVVACACSGEQIGVTAKTVSKAAELLGVIAGHDSKDGTSDKKDKYDYSVADSVEGKKVCIIKELLESASDDVKADVEKYALDLKNAGVVVEEVSFDLVEQARVAWQILLAAETCNNVSRFDGVKYGHRSESYRNIDELYVNSRTEGMGFLAKATILYGSDVLSKGRYEICYDKAMRIRRVVSEGVKKLMGEYDAVLMPVAGEKCFKAYDVKESFKKVYEQSLYTALGNMTGMPVVVTKGVQLMADFFNESVILSIANRVEEVK